MANTIKLPSGNTVSLKDLSSLKVGDRKRVIKATDQEEGDLSKAMALGDALIAMLIEDWSLDLIIPAVKIDSLDELTMADYDALVEETKDAQKYLFPNVTDDSADADPKVITENSKG
jgi:hypothetical protein